MVSKSAEVPKATRRRGSGMSRLIAPAIVVAVLLSSGALPVDPESLFAALGQAGSGATPSGPASSAGAGAASDDSPTASDPITPSVEAETTAPASPSSVRGTPMPVPPPRDPDDYLLMSRAAFMARPMSGPAWDALVDVADGPLGRPNLRNQDSQHGVRTLAVAMVYARTGNEAYRERAREAILGAIGTERRGAHNSALALGRQLGAYVLAADFIRLRGPDDETFRAWLTDIRTAELGGHGRWTSLTGTHEDAPNNWGSFAGASRIAASLYLGDGEDVVRAAQVLQGFLGDRSAWDAFQAVGDSADWACEPDRFTPVNPACQRDGIDLDGTIVRDISRGGRLNWPPGDDGIRYTLESLQGLILQAELLWQNGYSDPWQWSDAALRRATRIVTASGSSGGDSWNRSSVTLHLPWILNARYGLRLPTEPAGPGRIFGYTDWLYGA